VSCVDATHVLHLALDVRCSALDVFRFLSKAPTSFRILGIALAQVARLPGASDKCIAARIAAAAKRSVLELVLQKLLLPRTSWQRRLKLKSVL